MVCNFSQRFQLFLKEKKDGDSSNSESDWNPPMELVDLELLHQYQDWNQIMWSMPFRNLPFEFESELTELFQ